MSDKPAALKPIHLYDHLPGILAGYPAALFAILAVLSCFSTSVHDKTTMEQLKIQAENLSKSENVADVQLLEGLNLLMAQTKPLCDPHMLFWIGLSVMLVWYIAFRFNMPKSKFLLMFGLLGTFVGIPVVLEISGKIEPFSLLGGWLGSLVPTVNTGAWIVMGLVFFGIWLGNFIYSRTHMRVRIDESGLTLNRLGGKGERFELIGLKTENEPLDYLELFLAGVGSLSLKTRMNKPIFTMKRVVGLYRTPWFPFFKGKLARIEEMLSYQGKVVSVDRGDQLDAAEMADSDGDSDGHDQDDVVDEADDTATSTGDFDAPSSTNDSPDERGID
ncbi:MAG: hypothetical protein P8J27_17025 [Mariniblastus sp.]|nr:hypothetical protein [Mariniblastus sp.]